MDRSKEVERLELARKFARHPIRIECGVIIEEGDPCNSTNLLVNLGEIHKLAAQIKAQRQGRK